MVLTTFQLPERSRTGSGCCTGAGRDGDSTRATTAGELGLLNLYRRTTAAVRRAIANVANATARRYINFERCGKGTGTSALTTLLFTNVTSSAASGTGTTGAASS